MIAIAGTIDLLDPDDRDDCVARSVPYQRSTRDDEPGCLAYAFTADPIAPTRIQVFELWVDERALAAHFAHPNFSEMKEMLRGFERGPSAVQKYRIDAAEAVYDSTGTPRADFTETDA
jgi:quinol monooxygenase YgiN